MNLQIHFLGFLDLFTSSLPLILPMSILHFLGFLDPFTSATSYYSCGHATYYSCHSGLLGLLFCFLFSLSSYCWASSAIGPFVKSGHQHSLIIHFLSSQDQLVNIFTKLLSSFKCALLWTNLNVVPI